jgi:TRAP-type mannitol/chloroaromatic compound transport system permease small subunit
LGLLLKFSAFVDAVNEKIGYVCNWLVLLACVVSGGNAMVRYAYDTSSNAWLEIQWYMFAVIVMLGASYTLKRNEHVRVDLFYMTLSRRGQLWIDILGTLVFLLPTCVILAWLSWPFFMQSFNVSEHSSNAGGLVLWPIKLVPPVGFALLALQGVSELIKRVAFLNGLLPAETFDRRSAHGEGPDAGGAAVAIAKTEPR